MHLLGLAHHPPRYRPGVPSRLGQRVSVGVRTVVATIEPFAQHWRDANMAALASDGPLWVVVGDSSSVGIGASHPDKR
ncbi:MAG: hypothetical protein GY713_03410 [Actinomycetia bacterium]|nr:hypothetical protein [Actinomycetes bacterium]